MVRHNNDTNTNSLILFRLLLKLLKWIIKKAVYLCIFNSALEELTDDIRLQRGTDVNGIDRLLD